MQICRNGIVISTANNTLSKVKIFTKIRAFRNLQRLNWTKGEVSPQTPDDLEGIPDADAAIGEAAGHKAERELLGRGSGGFSPGEAVKALVARAGAGDGEVVCVGLEVELEDLEVGRGAEGEVHGAGHGSGGEVGRVRREGDERRPRRALDAGHGRGRSVTQGRNGTLSGGGRWRRKRKRRRATRLPRRGSTPLFVRLAV